MNVCIRRHGYRLLLKVLNVTVVPALVRLTIVVDKVVLEFLRLIISSIFANRPFDNVLSVFACMVLPNAEAYEQNVIFGPENDGVPPSGTQTIVVSLSPFFKSHPLLRLYSAMTTKCHLKNLIVFG